MAFRDEEAALRHRLDAEQRSAEEAERAHEKLEAEVDEARAQLRELERAQPKSNRNFLIVLALGAVALLLGIGFGMDSAAPSVETEVQPFSPRELVEATAPRLPVEPHWAAQVQEGSALSEGTLCTIDVTAGVGTRVSYVTVLCAANRLFFGTVADSGASPRDTDCTLELTEPLALRCRRENDRIDTSAGTARLHTEQGALVDLVFVASSGVEPAATNE